MSDSDWFYDDPANPTLIELCPNVCAKLQSDSSVHVALMIACDV